MHTRDCKATHVFIVEILVLSFGVCAYPFEIAIVKECVHVAEEAAQFAPAQHWNTCLSIGDT